MSFWSDVVDAWVTDLQTNVTGLDTTTVPSSRVHKYASWSAEELFALSGERHLAVWPAAEPDVTEGLLTDGSLLATQTYIILVWEDASTTQGRLQDDDTANAAWLTLHEAIRARLLVRANSQKGSSTIMDTRYRGAEFPASGDKRVMALRFEVRVPHVLT
jgi:hypothetical protein